MISVIGVLIVADKFLQGFRSFVELEDDSSLVLIPVREAVHFKHLVEVFLQRVKISQHSAVVLEAMYFHHVP